MGIGEIMPSKAQPEDELIISAPDQPEDNAQPEDNPSNNDNDQQEQYQMSMMGELKFFLGLQIRQQRNGIFIS